MLEKKDASIREGALIRADTVSHRQREELYEQPQSEVFDFHRSGLSSRKTANLYVNLENYLYGRLASHHGELDCRCFTDEMRGIHHFLVIHYVYD